MKEINEIGSFELGSKKYAFYLEDNKIKYGYYDNGVIKNDLTKTEIDRMNHVLTKIVISNDKKNHIDCGDISYNNKHFKVMYDKVSALKFFYEISGKKCVVPNPDDYYYLMQKYNDNTVLFIEGKDKKNKKFRRNIFLGSLVITVAIEAVGFCIDKLNLNKDLYKQDEISTEYNRDDLNKVVEQNSNLTKDEKAYVEESLKMVDDYNQYISMDGTSRRLSTIDIEYNEDIEPKHLEGAPLAEYDESQAYYSVADNKIVVNGYSDITDCPAPIKGHEVWHGITGGSADSLGVGLREAGLTGYTAEYLGNDLASTRAYADESLVLYSLNNLVLEAPMRNFITTGNVGALKDELMRIIPDEAKAIRLISRVDDLYNVKRGVIADFDHQEIYNLVNDYCVAEKNQTISETPEISKYMDNNHFNNKCTNGIENITFDICFNDRLAEVQFYEKADTAKAKFEAESLENAKANEEKYGPTEVRVSPEGLVEESVIETPSINRTHKEVIDSSVIDKPRTPEPKHEDFMLNGEMRSTVPNVGIQEVEDEPISEPVMGVIDEPNTRAPYDEPKFMDESLSTSIDKPDASKVLASTTGEKRVAMERLNAFYNQLMNDQANTQDENRDVIVKPR